MYQQLENHLHSAHGHVIQPQLEIGPVNDPMEREADAVADHVMRNPFSGATFAGVSSRQGAGVQRKCSECEAEERVQRKAHSPATAGHAHPRLSNQIKASQTDGKPLDRTAQTFMEGSFGNDFSQVRIHTDDQSANMNQELNARAFTVGNHIYFNQGQYQPESMGGMHLLAHELTHTLQQGKGIQKKIQRAHPAVVAGGAFAAGVIIGAVTFEAALAYGRSLATTFPGWLSVLPNCPCTEAAIRADPTWEADRNPALGWFHPGAASSYRTRGGYSTIAGSSHGQQCTYNSAGNLITHGPGAGTPDVWSPNTNGVRHTTCDAATWQVLGWRIYNRYWQPNNGNGCPAQAEDNTAMSRLAHWLP
jgi:hypothetical protein